MGIADQFKDKAAELEEQAMRARRIATGSGEAAASERASQAEEQAKKQAKEKSESEDKATEKAMQEAEDRLNQDYDI